MMLIFSLLLFWINGLWYFCDRIYSTGMLGWESKKEKNWGRALVIRDLPHMTVQELALITEVNEPKEEASSAQHNTLSVGAHSPLSPSEEESEMETVVPRSLEGRAVDAGVLKKFEQEYRASQEASRPVFEKYLPLLGPAALLDVLEEIHPACHGQAHNLGKALFAASKDLGASLRACGTRCTSGCMHGVVGEAFGKATLAAITTKINTFCEEGEMARLYKPGNCAHALGHALVFVNGGDVRTSIDACLGFANAAMQYYCATGVYMQKILTDPDPATPAPSWYYPCNEETLFPAACYRYKAVKLLDGLGTPMQLMGECRRLKDSQRLGCFHGLGHAVKEEVFTNPPQLAMLCRHGTQNDEIMCIEGAIEKLAEYDEERAKTACSFLSDALRPVCERAATDKMYSLTKSTFALYYDKEAVAQRRSMIAANSMITGVDYAHPDHQH